MPQNPLNQPIGLSFKHVTTGTVAIKTTPGMLAKVIINSASAAATLTFYDSLTGSGSVLAIITVGGTAPSTPVLTEYNAKTTIGLTVVVTGTIDATVTYA